MSRPLAPDAGQIVTGARYVEQITARESDRSARTAFHQVVLKLAAPGATVFDFGAGTGMDARFYAENGFKVAAYDVDPRMCDFFANHCRDLIEAGRVSLESGAYREFLARPTAGAAGVDLVTSNFAPLNLIGDLRELFAKFHTLTSPGGRVLASVLSPYFIGDMRYRWWWRHLLRLWRTGHYSVPGAQAPIVRRRAADFAEQSAPYFTLKRIFRGLPSPGGHIPEDSEVSAGAIRSILRVSTCRFMFLLFERQTVEATARPGTP